MSILRAIATRHITVDGLVFELRSVDASAMADVGHAYLEGVQVAAQAESEARAARLADDLRREGEDEAAVQQHVETHRHNDRLRVMRLHQQAVSTPEGAAAHHERMTAYVRAAVVGMGRSTKPLPRAVPTLPAWELHAAGERPEVEDWTPCRLVEGERPSAEVLNAALDAHEAAGEVPMWAIPEDIVEAIGLVAAQLAGGRAATMLPFRALAGDV